MDKIRMVSFNSYRSAKVIDRAMTLPRCYTRTLEDELYRQYEKAIGHKVMKDNDVTWSFSDTEYKLVFVQFSDGEAIFGNGMKLGNW